jgi:hypothetical protein
MSTTYKIANKDEYPAVFEYLGETPDITFPVIIAKREDKIVGVIGTFNFKQAVVAGPLKSDSSGISMRLCENYDKLLKSMGIKTYVFAIEKGTKFLNVVKKMDYLYKEYHEDEDVIWYRREYVQRTKSTGEVR